MSGTVYKTADGELLAAGDKIRVFNMNVNCGAGGNGVVELRDGGAAGNIYVVSTGTASTGVAFHFGDEGYLFLNGCYANVDANVNSIAVTLVKEP